MRYRTAICKLDANGKQLWRETQTGLSGMVAADMTTDAKANLYLTGKQLEPWPRRVHPLN